MRRFSDSAVASVFKAYPAPASARRLMALRELVFDAAGKTAGVGRLTETLKWGQPSYLTEETGSGTTVRIDRLKAGDGYAIYFHCQSGLVGQFRELYPDTFGTKASAPSCSPRTIACRSGNSATASRSLSPITRERRSRNRERRRPGSGHSRKKTSARPLKTSVASDAFSCHLT